MKTETDKFEWVSGEPTVTFNPSSATPTTFNIRAKANAPAGTYTINFVAVDNVPAESAVKSCKITITGAASYDLETSIPSFQKEGEASFVTSLSNGEVASGNKLTIRVTVKNNGSGSSSPVQIGRASCRERV